LIVHASMLAIALWAIVAGNFSGPGIMSSRTGTPKGNDFVQFYVAGSLARAGQYEALVDDAAFRRSQDPFLARSPVKYPAIYPPQVGLIFAPLSVLPYVSAYVVWAAMSIALVLACAVVLLGCSAIDRRYRWAAIPVALAFAPFPYMVLAGQISALSLCAFTLAAVALRRGSRLSAGLALGLLGYKASLFVPVVAICLLAGEWSIAAGAVLVAAVQTLAPALLTGGEVVQRSILNALTAARHADSLAMRPYLMFSWRTFWASLLSPGFARLAYLVCSGATILFAALRWRACSSCTRRIGVLSIATVLASPHLFLYDLVILIPALAASVEALSTHPRQRLYAATAFGYLAAFTVPIAVLTQFQIGTLVLSGWLVALGMHSCDSGASMVDSTNPRA
jgi:hypothetical protein